MSRRKTVYRKAVEVLREQLEGLEQDEKLLTRAKLLAARYNFIHVHQALRYLALLGDEAEQLLGTGEESVMKTIRVNTLLVGVEELAERLAEKGVVTRRHPYLWYGLVIEETPYPIGALHEYMQGLYTVQGPASMMVVPALSPEDAERIADMCAGAGVKTSQIAQHNPSAPIIAADVNRRKLLALKNNMSRLAVLNVAALHMDARRLPELGRFGSILLDAPCSGEGLLPFQRGRRSRSFGDIISRVELQLELLDAALDALEPRGVVVYATCSISVEENEYVVSSLLESRGDFEVEEPGYRAGSPGVARYLGLDLDPAVSRCRRFFPHRHSTEGFTICRLVKTS
ncbi:MAG TPA: RsmB/NOP family class I SAM-dependent RNA methyltransferase [Pyrodictium delaneyi]|uniref:RsmB/NOP family class I SAM-dependent RNA methyltransferase n=1 Tax=Pyrodictium delaneyi TaxID=1273541 RepID=A0A833E9B6_9CREN|nr:RsmB/NOP family class I SAM-dependent RNA methyltransferase [Pyrodictium delaneyi]